MVLRAHITSRLTVGQTGRSDFPKQAAVAHPIGVSAKTAKRIAGAGRSSYVWMLCDTGQCAEAARLGVADARNVRAEPNDIDIRRGGRRRVVVLGAYTPPSAPDSAEAVVRLP